MGTVTGLDVAGTVTGLDVVGTVTGLDVMGTVTGLDAMGTVTGLDVVTTVTGLDVVTTVTLSHLAPSALNMHVRWHICLMKQNALHHVIFHLLCTSHSVFFKF